MSLGWRSVEKSNRFYETVLINDNGNIVIEMSEIDWNINVDTENEVGIEN